MNPLGAGVDIIAVSRMRDILENSGRNAFLRKVYTAKEICRADQHADPVAFLARIFAAKEAVFKTFCIPATKEVQFRDIEICEGAFGQPLVELSGYFAGLARERGVRQVLLSISYDGDYAIAMAVLQGMNGICVESPMAMQKTNKEQQNKVFPSGEAIA